MASHVYGQFQTLPEGETLFGDVGPDAGCDEVNRQVKRFIPHYLERYRSAFIETVRRTYPPHLFSDLGDIQFSMSLDHLRPRIDEILKPLFQAYARDVLVQVNNWASLNGYKGRRLGYNAKGESFWAANRAMMGSCAVPASSRAQFLGKWSRP